MVDTQQFNTSRSITRASSAELQTIVDPFREYPALFRLRLAASDIEDLARQGFVSVEQRGNRCVHKLRFRSGGRQVVRSIASAVMANLVRAELERLQARRRICRELAALDHIARRQLRHAKAQLEPLMAANGWKFHGRAVRRPHPTVSRTITITP